MSRNKIVIAGGSGFLGRSLARWLADNGGAVVVLSRSDARIEGARTVQWDGRTVGPWAAELEGAAALINLAGRSVNCRYNAANRREMMDSRVESTRVLGKAMASCKAPPPVWLNAATATIYKHTYGEAHGEEGETGATPEAHDEYSIEVARAWEDAFEKADAPPGVRKVVLRAAMVLGKEPGGVYEVLRRLTRLGLGGKMGDGRQYVSWIHATDFCRAVQWLIDNRRARGIYNIAAPNPVPNAEMMATFRRVLGVPVGLPAARWMLEIGAVLMRTETELILKSRRVVPERLLREGFEFEHPLLAEGLSDLEIGPLLNRSPLT